MGSKYDVKAWSHDGLEYRYFDEYYGNSLIVAIWTIIKIKRSECKCVQFTIRW